MISENVASLFEELYNLPLMLHEMSLRRTLSIFWVRGVCHAQDFAYEEDARVLNASHA